MPVTMRDVVRLLSPDEANLNQAASRARSGSASAPRAPDPGSRPDARVEGGLRDRQIAGPRTTEILLRGATSEERMVRIAAATTLRSLPSDQANALLTRSSWTPMASAGRSPSRRCRGQSTPDVHRVVEMLALTDPYPLLRQKSEEILARSDNRPKDNTPKAAD